MKREWLGLSIFCCAMYLGTIVKADDNNSLIINGRFQPRFTYSAPNATASSQTFSINRGEIRLDGTVFSKQLKYGFEFGFTTRAAASKRNFCTDASATCSPKSGLTAETTTGLGVLNDYYLDWSANDAIGIKFGQFKVPYLYSELVSAMKQEFPDRSLTHDDFTLARDLGVSVHGALLNDTFNYNVFAMNGDGANSLNSNKGLLLGVRFDVPILGDYKFTESDVDTSESPNLLVGIATAYNQKGSAIENGSIPANAKVIHTTLDSIFRSHGFSLQGAGMWSRTQQGSEFTNWGYSVQSGVFLLPKHLELAARVASTMLANGIADQHEYGATINYYFNQHNLKLQTDYALLKNAAGFGATGHRVRTQLTVVF